MPKNILADTGFWFALFDDRDPYHEIAIIIEEDIYNCNILIPWPSLYETINTRFVRRSHWRLGIRKYITDNNVYKIDDTPYRYESLQTVIDPKEKRNFSLVDHVMRSMLEDTNLKVDGLITFNTEDFADICYKKGIELLYC